MLWSVQTALMKSPLPVAGVPDPRVPPRLGLEVRPADVVDLGGEAEQPSMPVGPVGLGCRFGEAVLLSSAVQHVQRPVLHVDRLLHQRGVQDQVGGRWAERERLWSGRRRGAGAASRLRPRLTHSPSR